jgi:HK97 gp10 family phage protein
VRIEVKGLDALVKKFDRLATESKGDIQAALNDFADRSASDAKRFAPADEGKLRQSISPIYGNLEGGIVASIGYAAYLEFGTRKFAAEYVASLPNDWQQLAQSKQGKSTGTFAQIARKILINGIRPQPYIYPAINKNKPLLIKDIKAILNDRH